MLLPSYPDPVHPGAHPARAAAVALAMLLAGTGMAWPAAAAVDAPSTYDDCVTGRRRTYTDALRLGIDPMPNCGSLLMPRASGAPEPVSPGVQR